MNSPFSRAFAALGASAAVIVLGAKLLGGATPTAAVLPRPTLDRGTISGAEQKAVFAGGCFWGVEAVFEHLKGVTSAVSGYAGGSVTSPTYELVSSGTTGHAEAVEVTFDPSQISYGQLLQVFFSVAHDPTQKNRQGPDVGPQYRSAIFYATDEQKRIAESYIQQLADAKTFKRPIVTEVAPLRAFYRAEAYHQDYLKHHPDQPYIVINDAPKVENLRKRFPELYRD